MTKPERGHKAGRDLPKVAWTRGQISRLASALHELSQIAELDEILRDQASGNPKPKISCVGSKALRDLAADEKKRYIARGECIVGPVNKDASWQVLLSLYLHDPTSRPLTVSNVCRESAVPETTALRQLGVLESHEFVRRSKHPADRRIHFIELTTKGEELVERTLVFMMKD